MFTENKRTRALSQDARRTRPSHEGRKRDRNLKGGRNGGTEEDREKLASTAKEQAIRLLARRDHSRYELRRKLAARGNPADVIDAAIAPLAESGLQSDERFTENFVRSALNRGHRRTQNPRRLALAWHPGSLGRHVPESRRRAMASPSRRSSAQALWAKRRQRIASNLASACVFWSIAAFSGELAFRVLGDASAFED